MTVPSVTIIVPVYRNRATLRELHRRVAASLDADRRPFEILFVDDACPAGSIEVLRELAAIDPRVAVLSLARNVGQHQAVVTAMAHARGEWVVVMDADLQDPPEAVPSLLQAGRGGYAVVFAGRRGDYESPARLATSRLFKWSLHVLTGVPRDAGIFCAVHRSLLPALCATAGSKPFLVAMIACSGATMTSIPVTRQARPEGASAYSAWGRLKSGSRGLRWVVARRLRDLFELTPPPPQRVAIAARLGERWGHCREACP